MGGVLELWSVLALFRLFLGGEEGEEVVDAVGYDQMKAGAIDEKYITIIVRETLTALGYLHKQGIIHRDIKGKSC